MIAFRRQYEVRRIGGFGEKTVIFLHGNSIYYFSQKIRTDIPLCRGNEVANGLLIVCKTIFDALELHRRYPFYPR